VELGLSGRRAIVTGASAGIGAATARALVVEGARVGIIARRADRLQVIADELGDSAVMAVGDLSTAAGVESSIDACVAALGGVDILVNNAGSSPSGTIDDLTDEQWQRAFDLKVMGYVRCMRRVVPSMRAQHFGRIINVGGTAGLHATPGYALAALNAALVHVTRSTAEHLGPDGITVVSLHPGPTLTNRMHDLLGKAAANAGMTVEQFAEQRVGPTLPLGRVGTPEEVAQMIVVLASDVASWVTGGGLSIDGGAARGVVGG
jgi:3-oxoacyl-[acyl-carrier protein] reductase